MIWVKRIGLGAAGVILLVLFFQFFGGTEGQSFLLFCGVCLPMEDYCVNRLRKLMNIAGRSAPSSNS